MNVDYAIIGKRIKKQRELKKIKIKEISKQLNVSEQKIMGLENGIPKITLSDFIKICEILNISVLDIFNCENYNMNTCIDKHLYELILQCNSKKQKLIYNIVNLAIRTQIV